VARCRRGRDGAAVGPLRLVASSQGPLVKFLTRGTSPASRTLEVKVIRSCVRIPVRLLTNQADSFIQEGKHKRKSEPAARSNSVVAGARS
jgi:hypothetical protein